MKIKLYDRVLLKDGNSASIVEIYEPDKYFIADIDTKDGTVTEDLRVEQIEYVEKGNKNERFKQKTCRADR